MYSKFLFLLIVMMSTNSFGALFYAKGELGLSVTTDGTLDGSNVNTHLAAPYPVTLGFGVHVSSMSSFALELNYETMKIDELPASVTAIGSDTQTQVSAMLSYYFHTPKILLIEPFIGVGAGYTQLTIEKNDFSGDGFTWQISGGVDIPYGSFFNFIAELRFFNPVDINLTDSNNLDVGDFNTSQIKLLVGSKFKF